MIMKERLVILGQLKEAMQSKEPNRDNRCRGLINSLIALETEESDQNDKAKENDKYETRR